MGKKRLKIYVKLTPRASRDEITGMRDGVLHVRVTAAPVAGKANDALRKLLAKRLRVPPSAVEIVRGERGRRKLVSVAGVGERTLESLTAESG